MKKKYTSDFKVWVEGHNPKINWDWDNPKEIKRQLIETIKVSNDIDIENIFANFFSNDDTEGLTDNQRHQLLSVYNSALDYEKDE